MSSCLSFFIVLICSFISAKGYHHDHAFLKGANSTLHMHICITVSNQCFVKTILYLIFCYSHWSSHRNRYIQKCQKLEITPDQYALPKQETEKLEGLSKQASLDNFVEATLNAKWSHQGLLEHVMDFVISDDQVSIVYYPYPVISKLFVSCSGLLM